MKCSIAIRWPYHQLISSITVSVGHCASLIYASGRLFCRVWLGSREVGRCGAGGQELAVATRWGLAMAGSAGRRAPRLGGRRRHRHSNSHASCIDRANSSHRTSCQRWIAAPARNEQQYHNHTSPNTTPSHVVPVSGPGGGRRRRLSLVSAPSGTTDRYTGKLAGLGCLTSYLADPNFPCSLQPSTSLRNPGQRRTQAAALSEVGTPMMGPVSATPS